MQESVNQVTGLPRGLSVAALVLGIVGVAMSVIPWCNWAIAIPCNILAIIFGSAAGSRAKEGFYGGEAQAKAGLVCGVVGLLIIALWVVLTVAAHNLLPRAPMWEGFEEEIVPYE